MSAPVEPRPATASPAEGDVAVSLAMGVATFPADGRSPTELIAAVYAELCREKRAAAGVVTELTA